MHMTPNSINYRCTTRLRRWVLRRRRNVTLSEIRANVRISRFKQSLTHHRTELYMKQAMPWQWKWLGDPHVYHPNSALSSHSSETQGVQVVSCDTQCTEACLILSSVRKKQLHCVIAPPTV